MNPEQLKAFKAEREALALQRAATKAEKVKQLAAQAALLAFPKPRGRALGGLPRRWEGSQEAHRHPSRALVSHKRVLGPS